MVSFYKRVAQVFLLLLLTNAFFSLGCALFFFSEKALLPFDESAFNWHTETDSDSGDPNDASAQNTRGSTIVVNGQGRGLEFSYTLSDQIRFPYAKLLLVLKDGLAPNSVEDLSRFHKASFQIRCSEYNTLTFNLRTYDANITHDEEINSYRMASHWLECTTKLKTVDVDLKALEVPEWWLDQHGIGVHDRSYSLEHVYALSFDSSRRGPIGTPVNVLVVQLTLHSYNWTYLVIFILVSIVIWAGFIYWSFKQHSVFLIQSIEEKLLKDKPLIAYKRLSIEPHRDKEKHAVLQFMAKEYVNPDLTMDFLIKHLGVNRKKVNEILKEEIGFTFKAYLNKLRLTEAARLVCESQEACINEIAYAVGYKNVTHFNKIFKDEYGCSPRKFKKLKTDD